MLHIPTAHPARVMLVNRSFIKRHLYRTLLLKTAAHRNGEIKKWTVGQTDAGRQKIVKKKGKKNQTCRILDFHSGGYDEFYLLRHLASYSFQIQLKFRRNMSPPSSGLKNKFCLLPAIHWIFICLFFNHEGRGDIFF
jgi:hypothetical protein